MPRIQIRLYFTDAELERNPKGLLYQGKSVLQRTMLRAGQGGVRKKENGGVRLLVGLGVPNATK
jgi:hypothetical protein